VKVGLDLETRTTLTTDDSDRWVSPCAGTACADWRSETFAPNEESSARADKESSLENCGRTSTGKALVTVAVPSFNQGRFLADALDSILTQRLPVEIFVADGGSSDESMDIIKEFAPLLAGWRSHRDAGQSAAINECVARGTAPYVCWLNSDDMLLPGGLLQLAQVLEANPTLPAVYGRAWNLDDRTGNRSPVWVEPFNVRRLALRCIVSQPATLMRRSCWEAIGGIDEQLHMSMDYDLWWRLYKEFGALGFLNEFVAINREHEGTKTRNNRRLHYREAMKIVARHYGSVPLKWWLLQPYAVWFRSLIH
jgi:glycosyltransferase involved in cell wall biosynthesis